MEDKKFLLKFRKFLGGTCMAVIPACIIFYLLLGVRVEGYDPYLSFSSFYWTNARNIFVIGISILVTFYVIYEGYSILDRIFSWLSAISLLGVMLFPVEGPDVLGCGFTTLFNLCPNISPEVSTIIHQVCGLLLFLLQGLTVGLLFTKSDGEMTKEKKIRNIIYYCCAGLIAAFVITLFINLVIIREVYSTYLCLILQVISFLLLGFCWLVKGEAFKFLNDK